MNKKSLTFFIISGLVLGALGSILYTQVLLPKLATIPFLIRHNLAPAPGPLVINTTQQVRVDDGSDEIAAIQRVTPWTVAILGKDSSGSVQSIGTGMLLTSDGLIATTKTVVANQTQLWAKTIDGTTSAATVVANDPASDLVFIQAVFKNQSSAVFGDPSTLQLGDNVILVSQANSESQVEGRVTYVATLPQDIPDNTIFFSDQINRTVGIGSSLSPIMSEPGESAEGSILAATDGSVVGIYSKTGIILANTIQSALSSYFNNNKQIIRPAIGIYYEYITAGMSAITGMHQGVLVVRPDPKTPAVVVGSAAQQSGIEAGDIIYKVNGTQIDPNHSFESLVFSEQPNGVLSLELLRGGNDLVVTVIVKQK